MNDLNSPFNPDWCNKPGNTITDCLESKHLTIEDFARLMYGDCSTKNIVEAGYLIEAITPITEEIAEKLETIVGGTKQFWLNREKQYREGKAAGKQEF